MTTKQRDALKNLLIKCEQLVAENEALRALFEVVEKHGYWTNSTWRDELQSLLNSPVREQYREIFAPILKEIDLAFQDSELSRLLLRIPTKGRPN